MFQYVSLYRQNAAGQHGKVIGFTILQFILCVFLPMAVIFGAMMLPLLLTLGDASGETVGVTMGITAFILIIVFFLVMIFIIYPIMVGMLRYFASAYKGVDFTFGDAYKVFKNGNYSKLIKIALLIFVINMALSMVIGFMVNLLMTVVLIPLMPLGLLLEDPNAAMTGTSIALIATAVVLFFVVVIVSYIPYIILYIYSAVVFMVYIDQPKIPTVDKLKIGWDVLFKSDASMVKLFFSNLILYILLTVVMFGIMIVAVILSMFLGDIQALIPVIFIVAMIISVIASIWITYLIIGSIVAYYFVGRDSLDNKNEMIHENTEPAYNNENPDLQ
ncbi:hypothetical protein GCM10007275_17930 [Jeotgalicoccus coquinae]|uniref:Membrane domain of glycerophosphoryl diester phosphodiesterase n=1 Tax=Jeotgalicoccus coquinae TaxID=709509 RepID=A0A6V7RNZ9_9STAP|nr:hypothetical protein [Jeotgalicoccus coquinae]MBB6424007.1 hypothetical protein [Jeotgalicoccus coquinae]GGE23224.1 hypothetical protein GCM10007275_17930 [Jeotgalicoccus coquinae]CAD2080105.1 hypothetical protein JEOCOQ751_01659 [Jeotgalicoccus coquinae]